MATYSWSVPTGKEITGTTYIKDTDNNISDTLDDLVEFVNGEGAHAGQGLTFDLVDKASVQTITGIKTFSSELVASGGVTGNITGALTGNSDTSTVLATGREISITGDVVATGVSFDGSANIQLTANFTTGMIMLWSGAVIDIPSGWYLCDGTNNTPNLLNRAIIGAGDEFAVGANGDGSVPSHIHSIDHNHDPVESESDSHTHTIPIHATTGTIITDTARGNGGTFIGNEVTSSDSHSHSVNLPPFYGNTGTYGSGTTVVPKHYALAYIMKG